MLHRPSFHASALSLHATIRQPFTRSSLDARSPFACRAALTFGVSCVLRMFHSTHAASFCLILFSFFPTDSFTSSRAYSFQVMHLPLNTFTCFMHSGFVPARRRAMRCRTFTNSLLLSHLSTLCNDPHASGFAPARWRAMRCWTFANSFCLPSHA